MKKNIKRIYILDTNVLLHDPSALFAFEGHDVVIPAVVLEELDNKKKLSDELGRNARQVARQLDDLRKKGRLDEGVELEHGGTLRIEIMQRSADLELFQESFHTVSNDNRILAVALNLDKEEEKLMQLDRRRKNKRLIIVVSKDTLVRIKADALGIASEDYTKGNVITSKSEHYTGFDMLYVDPILIDYFYAHKQLNVSDLNVSPVYPNQFFVLKDECGSGKSALMKVTKDGKYLVPFEWGTEEIWGLSAKNAQQRMALELLMDPDIPLVTISGKAGTGKTLLALAAALQQIMDEHMYKKLLVARPVIPLGKQDIGFLPGDKDDKMRPWIQPIYDNLEYLFGVQEENQVPQKGKKPGQNHNSIEMILAGMQGIIEIEALSYIRGRSIPKQFILIDEAQNLSKHEVKTIITRAGEGTKVVLVGDPEQIDHPYLDFSSNGLTDTIEKVKESPLAGHVTLEKGERSALAQLAADLL